MTDAPQITPARHALKVWLIVYSVCAIPMVVMTFVWAGMSAMASTTTVNAGWANTYALLNLAVPALIALGAIGGWIAFAARKDGLAKLLLLLPLAPFVLSLGMCAAWPSV